MKYDIPDWVKYDTAFRKKRLARKCHTKLKQFLVDIGIYFLIFIIPILAIYILASAFYEVKFTRITYAQEIQKVEREVVKAVVTAYTSSIDETDDRPWETASGGTVGHGSVACPERFKFGTRIKIGEKQYTCDDRMNKKYRDKDHFDIWKATKIEAFAFGRQVVNVEIL